MDHALYRIPVQEVRGYIRKSLRFMSVYDFVKTGPLAELVVKRFKSHRGVCKSDLAVYCSELESQLQSIQESNQGDLVAERLRIERYLPELRAVIAAEDVDGEMADAVDRATAARVAAGARRKRRAEERAEKELGRDRERKAKKRRLAKERAAAAAGSGSDGMRFEDMEE